MASPPTWDSIRRQTRSLENGLESSMTEFAKLAAQASTSYSSSGSLSKAQKASYTSLETEIQQGLAKLEELCEQMRLLVSGDPGASLSMQHTLDRHRDIWQDYTRDFKRSLKSYHEAEQRANLLGSVRSEIDAFKASTSSAEGRDPDTDKLLNERGHIDSSHRMADDVLGQAYATRHEFQQQRSMLSSANTRMGGVLGQIPGINSVLNMINARRRRDSVILGAVIGVCLVLLYLWARR